ncbi:VOC family protein [Dactylosporangium sp. AC04546]|uniref:VOC family protein n=1 Tax=Dactylosporangium sp. AC04546 TaxID=2862460 RepID=UPI001EDDB926|nr:VOC family protein [Dactylosporangium sp. AC04546]WVK79196.1 VOC family protein [Dactylosporangium sp. AC04546]
MSFHLNPGTRAEVDETMRNAVAAGGSVVREATGADWGGYYGYFADPDGHLWKVTTYGSE